MSISSFLKAWVGSVYSLSNDFLYSYAKINPEFACFLLIFWQLQNIVFLAAGTSVASSKTEDSTNLGDGWQYHVGAPHYHARECGAPSYFLDEDGFHYVGLYSSSGNGTNCEESYLTFTRNNRTYSATRTHTIVDMFDTDLLYTVKPCHDHHVFRKFFGELADRKVEIWGNGAVFYQQNYYSPSTDETLKFQMHIHELGYPGQMAFENHLVPEIRSCMEKNLVEAPGAPWYSGIPRANNTNDLPVCNNDTNDNFSNPLFNLVCASAVVLACMLIASCCIIFYYKKQLQRQSNEYKRVEDFENQLAAAAAASPPSSSGFTTPTYSHRAPAD